MVREEYNMAINLDTRSYEYKKDFNPDKIESLVNGKLPANHRIKIRGVNPFLGSAQQVYSVYTDRNYNVPVEEKPLPDNEIVDLAQRHVKDIALALGISDSETPEFAPDPYLKITATGERIVSFQQYHRGIPIFQMERIVWMERDGTIYNVIGTSVGLPKGLEAVPNVSVEQALITAITHLASSRREKGDWSFRRFRLKNYKPRVLAKTPLPSQPCVLEQKQLGEAVPAHLVFFYQGETTKLGWHFLISAPQLVEQYVVIVEARIEADDKGKPQVLYSQITSKSLAPIQGNVWLNNQKVNKARQLVDFPRPITDYPVDGSITLPKDFPSIWLNGDGKAGGNYTIVLRGLDLKSPIKLPDPVALKLDPLKEEVDEQKVLNAFYFCSFMHDFFYTLGFDEGAKNFQRVNPNGQGVDGDPVIVRISGRSFIGIASMNTLADGSMAFLNVGPHRETSRHGAIDADLMFHEYAHGVTNRLVGSQSDPQPLQSPQSDGMSEGWSDYFALTIQNYHLTSERQVIGDWIADKDMGLRNVIYNDLFAETDEGQFGSIGKLMGGVMLEISHDIGRIWCGALMKMNRDLVRVFNDKKKGNLLGWRIVIAGLQFTPSNPHYLQGRDSIIKALKCRRRNGLLTDEEFREAYLAVWKAFTCFGMGAKAISPSSQLTDLKSDTDIKNIPKPNLDPFDPI